MHWSRTVVKRVLLLLFFISVDKVRGTKHQRLWVVVRVKMANFPINKFKSTVNRHNYTPMLFNKSTKHLLIELEKMDGRIFCFCLFNAERMEGNFWSNRMTINEFKLTYPQINPNINFYSMDFDAERREIFVDFYLFVFVVSS